MSKYQIIIIFILAIGIFSCTKDEITTDSSAKLSFSTDTLSFDTVFTTIGSTTRHFMVHNKNNKAIKVSEIYLAKGENSNFRINVNGVHGDAENIEIAANDSLFVFVEVNVDPNRDEMVEDDSVVFITNGNIQDINLLAFGQDVILLNSEIIGTQTWTNDKPYLIYNLVTIDTLNTLTIEAGTQIYFHKKALFKIKGSLIVNGTIEEPVIFDGDRLEDFYDNVPDQWYGIHIAAGSKLNTINYAEIKNASFGFIVDSVVDFSQPTLTLTNSKILNMSSYGIYARQSSILAYNCIIGDCGEHALLIPFGGHYEFYHTTIANSSSNYWLEIRTKPLIFLRNYYTYNNTAYMRPLEKAYFGNCIIYGSQINELGYDSTYASSGALNFMFDHCILKIADTINTVDELHFNNIIKNRDPRFIRNDEELQFQLDTLSPAKDAGDIEISTFFPLDINGNSRIIDEGPDLGAYERIE